MILVIVPPQTVMLLFCHHLRHTRACVFALSALPYWTVRVCLSLFFWVLCFTSRSHHTHAYSTFHQHQPSGTNDCIVLIMVRLLFQFIQFFSLQNDYFNNNFALVVTFYSSFFSTRSTLRSNIWDATNKIRKKNTRKQITQNARQTAQLVRNWC